MIPYGRQDINQDDIDAVIEVLQSDFLTQGPAIPLFEKTVANYCGAQHAVAASSSTASLHIACLALDLGPGDWLWTSPNTFVASSNCALYCGAQVDFVDIDPSTYNMSVERLADKLALAEKNGKLPKVVMPVHLCGQSCDMASIKGLSVRYGFKIIEDASHGIGGKYKNEPIGNCRYSDITVFSFHPVKIITTGEGGMIILKNKKFSKKIRKMRAFGYNKNLNQRKIPGEYDVDTFGLNYRMGEINASIGCIQLLDIKKFLSIIHMSLEII